MKAEAADDAVRATKLVSEEFPEWSTIVPRLAEEHTPIQEIVATWDDIIRGKKSKKIFDPIPIKRAGKETGEFIRPKWNNPEALKEGLELYRRSGWSALRSGKETKLGIVHSVQSLKRFLKNRRELERSKGIAVGQTIPEFMGGMRNEATEDAYGALGDMMKELGEETLKREKSIGAQDAAIKKLLDPKEYDEFRRTLLNTQSPDDIHKRFVQLYGLRRADSIVNKLEKAGSSLEWLEAKSLQLVSDAVAGHPLSGVSKRTLAAQRRFIKSTDELKLHVNAAAEAPEYMPHIMSKELLDRYTEIERDAHKAGRSMADPTTMHHLHRKWRDELTGRPYSFEEVEEDLRKGLVVHTKHGPVEKTINDVFEQEGGILLKSGVTKPVDGVVLARPRDLANYWETDAKTIALIHGQNSAKSLTASHYLDEAGERFFKDEAWVLALPEHKRTPWVKVGDFRRDEVTNLTQRMGHLAHTDKSIERTVKRLTKTKGRHLKHTDSIIARRPDLADKFVEIETSICRHGRDDARKHTPC
jgi:hypothetical protein